MKRLDDCGDFLTIQDVAQCSGGAVCEATIRKACVDGTLPAQKLGRRWFIPRKKFIEYMNGRMTLEG